MVLPCFFSFFLFPKARLMFFYIRTVLLDTIKVYYSPTNAQVIVLKTISKFTLKYLRHVSMQSHHLQGAHYPCLLKLHFVKIVNYRRSVCDYFDGDVAAYIGPVLVDVLDYSRTVRHTHINKDTTNVCSHITTDLIIHR
jgi:hypothetical protein